MTDLVLDGRTRDLETLDADEYPEGLDVRVVAPATLRYWLRCEDWLGSEVLDSVEVEGGNVEVVARGLSATRLDAWVDVRPIAGAEAGDRASLSWRLQNTRGGVAYDRALIRYTGP